MLAAHKRSESELIEALSAQLAALGASCKEYDNGVYWEAMRIATTVYTLVNDGRSKSVSILTQLGIRSQIPFISNVAPKLPNMINSWTPLCLVRLSTTEEQSGYAPLLGRGVHFNSRRLPFKEWWEEQIFQNSNGQGLSRRELVSALRSMDGGSHYDPRIENSNYLEMKFHLTKWESVAIDGNNVPVKMNAHLATMRHIAFELEQSLSGFFESRIQNGFK